MLLRLVIRWVVEQDVPFELVDAVKSRIAYPVLSGIEPVVASLGSLAHNWMVLVEEQPLEAFCILSTDSRFLKSTLLVAAALGV